MGVKKRMRKRLVAHIVDVNVDAGVNVVEQIPADVVGILIDGEIVGAVPAPIGANGPVPFRNFKEETTGQPEAVMIAIEAVDAVPVGRAKVLEPTMLEQMFELIALICWTVA